MKRRFLLSMLALTALVPTLGWTADYPTRAIRMVVPFPAGSTTDAMARFLGERVSRTLQQTVVIENKPGAQGAIAAAEVARAAADGYTLLVGTNSTQAANIHLFNKLPYDPRKDFSGITLFSINPLVLVVRPDLPAANLTQLIEHAREKPGALNYGVGNSGSLVTAKKLMAMAQFSAQDINYPGSPQAVTDLVAGRLDFMITDVSVTRSHINSGKLRALGVTTANRIAVLPGVPTMAEAGVKGYEFSAWGGLFAPAKTPKQVIETLNTAFVSAIKSDEAQAFFERQGQVGSTLSPAQFDHFVAQEIEAWGRLLAQAGVKKQ
jgi:tripartite-type tricarboxylate transporter receptor subunit TctC